MGKILSDEEFEKALFSYGDNLSICGKYTGIVANRAAEASVTYKKSILDHDTALRARIAELEAENERMKNCMKELSPPEYAKNMDRLRECISHQRTSAAANCIDAVLGDRLARKNRIGELEEEVERLKKEKE